MAYTFELLGVSPVLDFFNHQQKLSQGEHRSGVEYLGVYNCTLDAFIQSIEKVPPERGWRFDRAVDTVVNFWLSNVETVRHWKQRLDDAGEHNLVVARLGDVRSLQLEFEQLFQ
jgi:plasmid maintenance system antidote protein VapI